MNRDQELVRRFKRFQEWFWGLLFVLVLISGAHILSGL